MDIASTQMCELFKLLFYLGTLTLVTEENLYVSGSI